MRARHSGKTHQARNVPIGVEMTMVQSPTIPVTRATPSRLIGGRNAVTHVLGMALLEADLASDL